MPNFLLETPGRHSGEQKVMQRSNNTQNGTFKCQLTRDIGPSVRICQLNIEGISRAKCDHLSRLLKENNVDVVLLQETHCPDENTLNARGKLSGYTLIAALYHHAYGIATYVKSTITNANFVESIDSNNIYATTIQVGEQKIVNVYKPPNTPWPTEVLPAYQHPAIYAGDFNSHHTLWKYESSDENGLKLMDWAEANHYTLIFDAKDKGTFLSGRWRRVYNPDLCFTSTNATQLPQQISRRVLGDFPHSQHRPVYLEAGIKIPLVNSVPQPRWNFDKAAWNGFSKDLDSTVRWIPPTAKNYKRFVGAMIAAAKKNIPRGYRKQYIPGWSAESERLYQEFECSGDPEIADNLLRSLDSSRKEKWEKTTAGLDFTRSSRKAWSLLRKLGGKSHQATANQPKIDPELIADRITETSKVQSDKSHTRKVKRALKLLKDTTPESSEFVVEITPNELDAAIAKTKSGKAAGFDGVYPEFIRHCGPNARKWLCRFYNDILTTGTLPREFKRTKVVAILKPGKPAERADSYRPIALLSTCYKVLERIIYNRIENTIDSVVPIEQAGFRAGRSCTDQVLSLTTYIEAGFQEKLKTAAVFVDLTAAYDTVWRTGLIYKLLRTTKCNKLANLINHMLSNRSYQVFIDGSSSSTRQLNNGLPQGSVLAPLLFNLYIHDMPTTMSRKFQYADDLAIATQHHQIPTAQDTLSHDLNTLETYFKHWRLTPSMNKTESACFHLNNRLANAHLEVTFGGVVLQHARFPKYLGVTLDRSLTFKRHLENTAAKLTTRNNLLLKLASSSWGASPGTLRTAALALVYPTAEYAAPVWLNSPHSKKIDTQLNSTMRLISGTIQPTPVPWLPVLSNIAPPHLRRSRALLAEYNKVVNNPDLPIHSDIDTRQRHRLKSRKPPLKYAAELQQSNFDVSKEWERIWREFDTNAQINSPTDPVPGFDLPRHLWCKLNRIRTNHGRCADSLFRWGALPSSACDCGEPRQTINHIVVDCPRRCFLGDLTQLHNLTPEALTWLQNLDIAL